MSHDSNRTRIWFPMFSYFESSVDGIIPNEYNTVENVLTNIFSGIIYLKDCCMLTARRFWIAHNNIQFTPLPKNSQLNFFSNNFSIKKNKVKEGNSSLVGSTVAAAAAAAQNLNEEDILTADDMEQMKLTSDAQHPEVDQLPNGLCKKDD